jgi:hypothetical protein
MITYVSEARNPPWNTRPYTVRGALASLLAPMAPGASIVIGGIITLSGNRVAPRDIRSTISAVTPPGQQFACRMVQGEQMKVWRIR